MKKVLLATILMVGVLAACNQKDNQTKTEENMQKLELTQEWDKVFPLSDKVNHRKVTFETQYGLPAKASSLLCQFSRTVRHTAQRTVNIRIISSICLIMRCKGINNNQKKRLI
jgi:hypothetical protein